MRDRGDVAAKRHMLEAMEPSDGAPDVGAAVEPSGRTAFGTWTSPLRSTRRAVAAHFGLTVNAGAMALATFATGAFGLVYWWVSVRSFTPKAVGLASADISLIGLLSMASELGLGTMLLGEIPRRRGLAPLLISAALLASLASAGVFGLAYLGLSAAFAPNYGVMDGFSSTRLLVFAGVCAQTASAVLDAALVGMLNAPLRLFRNLLFVSTKLALIIGAAAIAVPADWQLNAIVASWVGGQCFACLGLASLGRLQGARVWYRPRFDLLRSRIRTSLSHYALNCAAAAPTLVIPVIVALELSPERNAPFYAVWMLLNIATVIPTALATVLFTIGSRDSSNAIPSIRFSLAASLIIGLLTCLGFWLLSDVALRLLNPAYPRLIGSELGFLGIAVPLTAIKVHYMTVKRLDNRVSSAVYALSALGLLEILSAAIGARLDDLFGATMGWLLALAFEASLLWPTIWRRVGGEGAGIQ